MKRPVLFGLLVACALALALPGCKKDKAPASAGSAAAANTGANTSGAAAAKQKPIHLTYYAIPG